MMTDEAQFMEPLQLAGEIIMENGGETYRAEETIRRMGEGFGLRQVESFAVPSGLFISYKRSDGYTETGVLRVRRLGTNLTRVDEVNQISRLTEAGKLTCAEAAARLHRVRDMNGPLSTWLLVPAAALCAGGFAVLFQGGWLDLAVAAVVAALVQAASLGLEKIHMQAVVTELLGGLLTSLLPMLVALQWPALSVDATVAGAIMPLVPGLAMANAVQDSLRGDVISGLSHGASALMTACLVAGGALISPVILRLLTGGGF